MWCGGGGGGGGEGGGGLCGLNDVICLYCVILFSLL